MAMITHRWVLSGFLFVLSPWMVVFSGVVFSPGVLGTDAAGSPKAPSPVKPKPGPSQSAPARPPGENPASEAEINRLTQDISIVFQSGGEEGLLRWARQNADKLSPEFIIDYAAGGNEPLSNDLLSIAWILVRAKGDPRVEAKVHNLAGDYHYQRSENAQALEAYRAGLAIFEALNDPAGRGACLFRIGNVHRMTGDRKLAEEFFDQALPLFREAGDLKGIGAVLTRKGDLHSQSGNHALAEEMYGRALESFQKAGDPRGQGGVLKSRGDLFLRTNRYERALEMYDQALACYGQLPDAVNQAEILQRKGAIYFRSGDSARALEMYDQALPFFEKAAEPLGQGNVWFGKGSIHFYRGDHGRALEMFDRALTFYARAQEPLGQGNVLYFKGECSFSLGDNASALDMYAQALPFYEQTGEPRGQGNIWKSRGAVLIRTGDPSKAMEMYDKALQFYRQAGDVFSEGIILRRKGEASFQSGDFGRALELYSEAIRIFEKVGEPRNQGVLWASRGDVLLQAGDNDKALEMYDQALPFFERVSEPQGQGNIWRSRADILLHKGELARATEAYDQALSFFEKARDPLGQGSVWARKGDLLLANGQAELALEPYRKSLSFYSQAENTLGQAEIWRRMGEAHARTGSPATAMELLEKALTAFEKIGSLEFAADTRIALALETARIGRVDQASLLFETGLADLETVRRECRLPDLKQSYLKKVYGSYESAALFFLSSGQGEKGFRVVESMKARSFLDRLAETGARIDKGVSPDLKQKKDLLSSRLNVARRALTESADRKDEPASEQRKAEIRGLEKELRALGEEIRLKNPLYASIQYPEIIDPARLRAKTLRPGELLAEYFLAEEGCWVFLVSRKRFEAVRLDAPVESIRKGVEDYLAAIRHRRVPSRPGAYLYEVLVAPVERRMAGQDSLIIVPDGFLARLPLEALPAGKQGGRIVYLVEKRRVSYIQSASVLAFLRSRPAEARLSGAFSGFGDPVYNHEDFAARREERGGTLRTTDTEASALLSERWERIGGSLERLPGTGDEVKAAGNCFSSAGRETKLFLRENATESQVKDPHLSGSSFLHFACHGLLSGQMQCLVLSRIPDSAEDGFLEIGEIMNLSWNARLVVLSACETGRGIVVKGEGVTGLTRAVMYAGTPAVVASLWGVSDEGTAELMARFYHHLVRGGCAPAEALRRAKLDLLRTGRPGSGVSRDAAPGTGASRPAGRTSPNPDFAHPFYWAGFILFGE